jgi:non-specific serine/threonine protein kinase
MKVVRGDLLADPSTTERFRREAVAVARLRHPHIVTVHDYGVAEGVGAYLVLELLEGRSLREELAERKRLDAREALDLMRQVCQAVEAAHRAGVVHRDLKPDNIFLERREREGGAPATVVKVLDFGLAKLEEAFKSTSGALTARGLALGTPAYMSPEQCRGEWADARSDVYALGCVLYEMVSGRPPFLAPSAAALIFKHIAETPRRPRELAPDVGPSLDEALMRALEKAPERRHQTVGELARALGVAAPSSAPLADTPASGGRTDESPRVTDTIEGAATAERPPTNLPEPITRFVGREQEIADARERLEKTRLVTLVGPGGIGKTRLALEVASRARDEHGDGVFMVALAPLADAALMPQTVASVLGVREQDGCLEIEAVEAWLRAKRLLLVLDNCEHLVDACARLAERLLTTCPGVRVLATSREALGVAGEAVRQVPALAMPAQGAEYECEAVRLFVERASFARPGFEATDHTLPAIATLCRRLEGIPLAIELAAARARALSVEQILARLDDRFRLLSGGSRTAPSRQQTLRATLDWSYDLLTEEERAILRCLSVFAGGWTLEDAEGVLGKDDAGPMNDELKRPEAASGSLLHPSSVAGTPDRGESPAPPDRLLRRSEEVLQHLERLVDKSLVAFEWSHGPRYSMLEFVRQYAEDKLRESGEWEYYRTRHRDWFVRFATDAYEAYRAFEARWLDRLDVELDNLRSALQWSIERVDGEDALRLCCGLMRLWDMRGRSTEGRTWFDRALAIGDGAPGALRGRALHDAGTLAQNQGDFERAMRLYDEGLPARRAAGDERGTAQTLRRMGDVALRVGRYDEAEASYVESLALYRAVDHKLGIGLALGQLGMVALARDDPARAAALYGESLEVLRPLGHKLTLAVTLHNLGEVEHRLGNFERAVELLEESLEEARESGYKGLIAMSTAALSAVATDVGEYERAFDRATRALAIFDEIGDKLGTAVALERAACTAAATGRPERALRLLGAAASLRDEMGSVLTPLESTHLGPYVDLARASLDAADAARTLEEGRAMTKADAIAYATERFVE